MRKRVKTEEGMNDLATKYADGAWLVDGDEDEDGDGRGSGGW